MKIFGKKAICLMLALLLVIPTVLALAGCKQQELPLVISTEALDGVFNPFTYTSGADGGIVNNTQLGMLSIDKDGNIVAGADQPTVALDYSVVTTGDQSDYDRDGDYRNYYTDYYFVIKDGIKFSDGTDLTIKDVLFNMYVYLDPVYTGSSTMYSIGIQGLESYRTQVEGESDEDAFNQTASNNAMQRLDRLVEWCNEEDVSLEDWFAEDQLTEVKADIEKTKELFREELQTDWASAQSVVEEYEKYVNEADPTQHISQGWEVFLIMYGEITTKVEKDLQGNKTYTFAYNGTDKIDHSEQALIDYVYGNFLTETNNSYKDKLLQVITMYNTSNTLYEYFVASEKGKLLHQAGGDTLAVPSVSGIQVLYTDHIPTATATKNYDKEYDVLKIRINGVDPKAIYSFSFGVAPMNYYSTSDAIANFKELENTTDAEGNTVKNYSGFGVKFADTDFMSELGQIRVPRGAGPYRATDNSATGTADDAKIEVSQFYNNNIVYFERNNYFDTVMEGGHNAYIKFLRYKVIASSSMLDAVTGRNAEVHISMPTATSDINNQIQQLQREGVNITVANPPYMGYGYIGINASKVTDINIRRAIMHAMDVTLCTSYYGSSDLVQILYRPISANSPYYPKDATAYYAYDETGETSLRLAQDAGYSIDSNTGILTNAEGEKLSFTFTIAGETEDHPAYQTMVKAQEILNDIGFDITVTKDTQALSKLASGGLTVWAAAWSSTIDPDMYQVYHKDSKASSVKNWGYPYLLREGTVEELEILDNLAYYIEEGRKYTEFDQRVSYYHEALDLVMELAVELPTYQRTEMYVINSAVIDKDTLTEWSVYQSPISEIWNIQFVS